MDIPKWSEILDKYEVTINQPDWKHVYFMFDRTAETPVSDVYSEDIQFLIVADSILKLQTEIDKIIPRTLHNETTSAYTSNWGFIRSNYRCINYNGERMTIAQTEGGLTVNSAVNRFTKTYVPTINHWFCTTLTYTAGEVRLLSKTIDDSVYTLVADTHDEMLALLIRSGHQDIAGETMAKSSVTLAIMNLTKIMSASDGILYRGEAYTFTKIFDEIHDCVEKLTDDEETLNLIKGMQIFMKVQNNEF